MYVCMYEGGNKKIVTLLEAYETTVCTSSGMYGMYSMYV